MRAAAVVGNYCRQQPLATHRDKMERGQHFGAGIALFKINAYYNVVYNSAGRPASHSCVFLVRARVRLCVSAHPFQKKKNVSVSAYMYTRSLDTAIKSISLASAPDILACASQNSTHEAKFIFLSTFYAL